jgi:hypothetical protein
MTLKKEKREHVLTLTAIDGGPNRLQFLSNMEASDKTTEQMAQHKRKEIKLVSLETATYDTYVGARDYEIFRFLKVVAGVEKKPHTMPAQNVNQKLGEGF